MNRKNIWIGATSGIINLLSEIKTRPLVWNTITTSVFSTIGKGIGFLIPFFVAAWFGVTSETDAFFFAYGLILFLSGIFAPVIESLIVPYIIETRAKNEDVGNFVGRILGISGIGLAGLGGLFLLIIKPFLSLITHFDPASLDLAYILLAETTPLIILLVWTSILGGSLNAYKKFTFPALSPAFRAIVNLIIIFAFKDIWGVHTIAWGYVIGEIFRVLILLSVVYKSNLFSLRFSVNLDSKFKEFFKTASYQVLGMVVVGLNPVIDKIMASWLGTGSVSVLYYAERLYVIPVTFISSGLMVTLLSHWSERHYEKGVELHRNLWKSIKFIILLGTFITILLTIFSGLITRIAYSHGEFATKNINVVSLVLNLFLVGFPFSMAGICLSRALLVMKRTKELLWMAIFNSVCNITLNFIFMRFIAVAGIALATSAVSTLGFLIFINRFNRFYREKTFSLVDNN